MMKDKNALEGGRISVLGARVHNLKNIDVDIPRNKLSVITGMSGSGKSSLAFDTIFAEGQRRYVETFSAYARNFLGNMERPDVLVPCEECHGKRYNRETLEVRFRGKSIADILDMTINMAVEFFENIPSILSKVKVLQDVGLGYIKLGQPSTTLSGGESQRVKLATELAKKDTGKTLYVLDEPTTGLHFEDIRVLLGVLNKLVDKGNTIIVIEHNLDVIKCADYLIDMGPEGGRNGGQVLFTGTPEEMVKAKTKSYTAPFLKDELKSDKK